MAILNKDALLSGYQMAFAALIAFVIYHLYNLPYGYWSVVTIAAISQPNLLNTNKKLIARLAGTIIGALLGLGILLVSHQHLSIMLVAFFIVVFFATYFFDNERKISYTGIVLAITISLVVISAIETHQPVEAALLRTGEVLLGIMSCVLVNVLLPSPSYLTQSDIYPKLKVIPKINLVVDYLQAKNAFKTALAASVAFLPSLIFQYNGGFWAIITCFAVMEESIHFTRQKVYLRFLAHIITALIGGLSAIIVGVHTWLLAIPLVIIYIIFGYLSHRKDAIGKMTNTMAIALAVMMLDSPGVHNSFIIIGERFMNVCYGVIVALLVTQFVWPVKEKSRL